MALRDEGFWNKHYELELKNYNEHGDEGEVWFGRALSRRIANWVLKRLSNDSKQVTQLLDIGCGNGFFLKTLFENWPVSTSQPQSCILKATGIDYSEHSVNLTEKIVKSTQFHNNINLRTCDFLDRGQVEKIASETGKFDFLIDIGTYDAICLIANKSEELSQTAKLKYITSVYSLAHQATIFILASCNHTEKELMSLFSIECPHKLEAHLIDRVETPKLQFGGKEGSQVTCLILQFSISQSIE